MLNGLVLIMLVDILVSDISLGNICNDASSLQLEATCRQAFRFVFKNSLLETVGWIGFFFLQARLMLQTTPAKYFRLLAEAMMKATPDLGFTIIPSIHLLTAICVPADLSQAVPQRQLNVRERLVESNRCGVGDAGIQCSDRPGECLEGHCCRPAAVLYLALVAAVDCAPLAAPKTEKDAPAQGGECRP